ncbi:hypothetical protein [Actinacidiphila glaucinigra]|uniref:hypothetical protein n=1 Tax=Actinacidiphila glaucinigra TaxID=235986 RepID=UPI0036712EB5
MTATTLGAPARIQRGRTKGWRPADAITNPNGAVIVGQPSRYGNACTVAVMREMGYADPHAAANPHVAGRATTQRPDRCGRPAA